MKLAKVQWKWACSFTPERIVNNYKLLGKESGIIYQYLYQREIIHKDVYNGSIHLFIGHAMQFSGP